MKVGEDILSGNLICGRSCLCDSCHTPEWRVNPKFSNIKKLIISAHKQCFTSLPLPLYRYLCNDKDGEILNF